jgi:hypothetical protein
MRKWYLWQHIPCNPPLRRCEACTDARPRICAESLYSDNLASRGGKASRPRRVQTLCADARPCICAEYLYSDNLTSRGGKASHPRKVELSVAGTREMTLRRCEAWRPREVNSPVNATDTCALRGREASLQRLSNHSHVSFASWLHCPGMMPSVMFMS